MEHLKKIHGFLDSMGTNRNKPPADDLMVSCKKQLTDLRDEIMVVKQQFSQYAHQVVEAAEASVTLSKSVDTFYSKANHPGRSESVNMYKKVQEEIANRAVNTFHITVENGLISELSEWVQLIANLHEKISAAESTRIIYYATQNRLNALQNEYVDKKSSKKGIFGGNRESDLEDLQQKISESKEAEKSLSLEYQNQRNNIAQQVKQLMEKRYRYFDRIYVQMLECQAEYFQHAANVSKRFQRDIDYYRKQYPKTNEFHASNGSIPNLDALTAGMNDEAKGLLSGNSEERTNNASIRPKVPITKPPKKNSRKNSKTKEKKKGGFIDNDMSTQSTSRTESRSQSQSQSPQMNPQPQQQQEQSPVKSKPAPVPNNNANMNGDHTNGNENNNNNNAKQHGDMLNVDAPMSPQPPKPNIQKQPSLFTGLFGPGPIKAPDSADLFTLANPNSNDMLGDMVGDMVGMKPLAEQKSSSHDPNDIFGDFIFGGADNNIKKKPTHGHQDSTSEWFSTIHHPPSESQESKSMNSNNGGNLEDQMSQNFNSITYGSHNGHSQQSPQIPNSTTGKVPTNGANAKAAAATPVQSKLNAEDKEKLVNMKLSEKGKQNAQKAYEEKMRQRKKEEDEAEMNEKEKLYWKEKHDEKLNKWEFENHVRRNIRVLIGKLPEVLPSNLNWKPIPLNKLLTDALLKRGYYKAVRVVHPDKSIGRGDSMEDRVICDYVFQALEQAFNTKFG